MPRFTVGARVRMIEEKTTGRIGRVVEVLPKNQPTSDFDRYRVEFPEGDVKVASDLELSPAGTPMTPSIDDLT